MFNINVNFCWWLDSNRGPLVMEVTALPTEPQPLPFFSIFVHWEKWKGQWQMERKYQIVWFINNWFYLGGSPALVVMVGDWCSRGHEFESQHQKLFFRFTFLLNFFLTRKYGLLCISVILFSTIYLPNFSFATPKALLPLTRALPFCLFVRSSVLFFSVYFSFSQSPSNIPHSSDRSGRFD